MTTSAWLQQTECTRWWNRPFESEDWQRKWLRRSFWNTCSRMRKQKTLCCQVLRVLLAYSFLQTCQNIKKNLNTITRFIVYKNIYMIIYMYKIQSQIQTYYMYVCMYVCMYVSMYVCTLYSKSVIVSIFYIYICMYVYIYSKLQKLWHKTYQHINTSRLLYLHSIVTSTVSKDVVCSVFWYIPWPV